MAAASTVGTVNFTSDMNANAPWDAQVPSVPYPSSISIAESDNIIAELSMYASAMNTPLPQDHAASSMSDVSDDMLFRRGPTSSLKRKMSTSLPLPDAKMHRISKTEHPFETEPVTPNTRSRPAPIGITKIPMPAPLSPACQSLCTEEADETPSMPPTPIPADLSSLPSLSKEQTARRRALRKIAMKRNRGRKEEGVSIKCEPTMRTESESSEPVDKRAARAIRNREAAMKSRVEAKQKMKKLQDENSSLALQVKTLSDENQSLTAQLKSLMHRTLGVTVAEGQDLKEVFNMLAPLNTANRTA